MIFCFFYNPACVSCRDFSDVIVTEIYDHARFVKYPRHCAYNVELFTLFNFSSYSVTIIYFIE